MITPGKKFRLAIEEENPLQIVGTINPYSALLAERAHFKAIYLSGAGVANASLGLPDLGVTNLNDVLEDARRITNRVDLPLLVDIDTGFGNAFTIARTIREMIKAGVAAIHIEDQIQSKRCGHRPGKNIVSTEEMVDRLKVAVDARTDPSFVIMARTDALQEGLNACVDRALQYVDAGADALFFEGVRELSEYHELIKHCAVPVLANITEFGLTPLFTKDELCSVGVRLILYPLSAFRAMNFAAFRAYQVIRQQGTQESLIGQMQTREELYDLLNYYDSEKKLDQLLGKRYDKSI